MNQLLNMIAGQASQRGQCQIEALVGMGYINDGQQCTIIQSLTER